MFRYSVFRVMGWLVLGFSWLVGLWGFGVGCSVWLLSVLVLLGWLLGVVGAVFIVGCVVFAVGCGCGGVFVRFAVFVGVSGRFVILLCVYSLILGVGWVLLFVFCYLFLLVVWVSC